MGPMCYAAKQRALFVAPSLLEMTEINFQPPGVKGQWIKVSECPPPESENCERRMEVNANSDSEQYWRPNYICDSRPFTLPATSVSSEATPSKPKLAVGQVWRRRDRKTITIESYDKCIDRFHCSDGYFYGANGKAYLDSQVGTHIQDIELVELVWGVPRESVDEQNVSPESVERKIEELGTTDSGTILAKGDDETLWYLCERPDPAEVTAKFFWVQIPPLPAREA
jgi:hypothetical protein